MVEIQTGQRSIMVSVEEFLVNSDLCDLKHLKGRYFSVI